MNSTVTTTKSRMLLRSNIPAVKTSKALNTDSATTIFSKRPLIAVPPVTSRTTAAASRAPARTTENTTLLVIKPIHTPIATITTESATKEAMVVLGMKKVTETDKNQTIPTP